MKLIIGLGNPGEKYAHNRHNVGAMFVDFLTGKVPASQIKLLQPDTFMNDSGKFVSKQVHFYKVSPDDLFIAHDDLDIPLGKFKIQKGTGPKLHNGLESIEQHLGTADFWRIRIGVENRGDKKIPGETYVLQNFSPEEREQLPQIFAVILDRLKISA